jgi:hypothetical protein
MVEDEALIAGGIADLCEMNGYEVCGTAFNTAQALFVSVNTVKYHFKNLYDRFDAHNRVELLAKLQELVR